MFAEGFQGPVTEYIKDAKTGEEIPIPKLNRCGMIVYFLSISVALITFISYLTLASFDTQTSTIGNVFIEGQNCSILSTFSGDKILGLSVENRIKLTYGLSGDDEDKLNICVLGTCETKGKSLPLMSGYTNTVCPEGDQTSNLGVPIKNSYGHVDLRESSSDPSGFELYDVCYYDTFEECMKDQEFDNVELVKKLLGLYSGSGIIFDTKGAITKGIPEAAGGSGTGSNTGRYIEASVPLLYDAAATNILLEQSNDYKSVYFTSEKTCLANLKLVSADMVEVDQQLRLSYVASPTLGSFPYVGSLNNGCYIPVKFRQIDLKFSVPGFNFKMGPSTGTNRFFSNLVCDQSKVDLDIPCCDGKTYTKKPTFPAKSCGYITEDTYDPKETMELFELLYPQWTAEACSAFAKLSPIQCIETVKPSVVTAAANSLALFNSFLGGLFLLACYLMSNGYDVYSYLFEGKEKAVDAATASDEKDEDTKTKPQEEVEASTIQSNPMTTNPMTSEA